MAKRMYEKIADINARIEDSVSGVRVVQAFTNEDYEINRFSRIIIKNSGKRSWKAYKVMAYTRSSIYMSTRLATLIVLVVGAWFSFHREPLLWGIGRLCFICKCAF